MALLLWRAALGTWGGARGRRGSPSALWGPLTWSLLACPRRVTTQEGKQIAVRVEGSSTDHWSWLYALSWGVSDFVPRCRRCWRAAGAVHSAAVGPVCAPTLVDPALLAAQVWAAFLATCVGAGFIIWGLDLWMSRVAPPKREGDSKSKRASLGAMALKTIGRPVEVGAGTARCCCACRGEVAGRRQAPPPVRRQPTWTLPVPSCRPPLRPPCLEM